jgi:hypothetical protein
MDIALRRMDVDRPSGYVDSDEEMADQTPMAVQKQEKQRKDKKKEKKDKKSQKNEEGASDAKKRKHADVNGEVDGEKKKKKKKKSTAE